MSNVPATTDKKRDIRSLIQSESVKQQIALVLPKHLTAERMARVACTAILKTPKLASCTPESLLQALMLCSQAGLEPDGRNAHLIPYGDQVQVIFDYKGLVALARRNGIQNISGDVVCENDVFEWYRDANGLHFKHQIDFRKPRGAMFSAFCIWKDGDQFDGEVMTKEEVDAIRKRSRAGTSGPWVTDYNEMAKKTVVRRASKKWPLDAEIAEALNDADSASTAGQPAKPQFDTQVVSEISDAGKSELMPSTAQEPQQESACQFLIRSLTDSGVTFDDFRDFAITTNKVKNADSWASLMDVPEDAAKVLVEPAILNRIIKTYGKKKA